MPLKKDEIIDSSAKAGKGLIKGSMVVDELFEEGEDNVLQRKDDAEIPDNYMSYQLQYHID